MILHFFCGATVLPRAGKPIPHFNDDVYPTASTCALEMTLPTRYNDYKEFKYRLDQVFTMHRGFGKS